VFEGEGMILFTTGVLHTFGKTRFDLFDLPIGMYADTCHLASHLAGESRGEGGIYVHSDRHNSVGCHEGLNSTLP
jgi:predicted patatin/cPLA2 family phospholipase